MAISAPAAAHYYGVARVAPEVFEARFFPQLLLEPAFWQGWLAMLHRVAWLPFVVAGLAGVLLSRGEIRSVLLAAWGGYILMGLLFTHHIQTHDYYSLPIIPVVGLSIAALVDVIYRAVPSGLQRRALGGVALAGLVVGIGSSFRSLAPLRPASELDAEVARYERIGEAIGHSTSVISLDGSYGVTMNYHGWMAASNWPLSFDLAISRLMGQQKVGAEQRLAGWNGDFFVATAQAELDAQPDLRDLLNERYPVLVREGRSDRWDFLVYDLRHSRISIRPARLSVFATADGTRSSQHLVKLWSSDTTQWRLALPTPELFEVQPAEGRGPASLRIVPHKTLTEIDKVVEVPIYSGDSARADATLTLRLKAVRAVGPAAPFGWVDLPAEPITRTTDPLVFQGWALDDFDLRRIWAGYVDGGGKLVPLGEAEISGMRPDVATLYPDAHDIFNAAWAFTLGPETVARLPRPAVLRFFAEDGDGRRTEIGSRTID